MKQIVPDLKSQNPHQVLRMGSQFPEEIRIRNEDHMRKSIADSFEHLDELRMRQFRRGHDRVSHAAGNDLAQVFGWAYRNVFQLPVGNIVGNHSDRTQAKVRLTFKFAQHRERNLPATRTPQPGNPTSQTAIRFAGPRSASPRSDSIHQCRPTGKLAVK